MAKIRATMGASFDGAASRQPHSRILRGEDKAVVGLGFPESSPTTVLGAGV